MPYSIASEADWTADPVLLGEIEGGAELAEWFGFMPDFHDATIRTLKLEGDSGILELSAFRMTNKVDEKGFYVLDRHARVTFWFREIRGIVLDCNPITTIFELGIRRIASDQLPVLATSTIAGDYELGFDDVCAGSGSIYAKVVSVSIEAEPTEPPKQEQ